MSADEEAQNIVESEEEVSPNEAFDAAFAGTEEVEAKAEETPDAEESPEEEDSEDKEDTPAPEDSEEDTEEKPEEELSALELAENRAKEKFLEKDEDKDDAKKADDEEEKPVEGSEAKESLEIDFTDVDSDPGKFISDLINTKVPDDTKKARLKETIETYPEIGELTALVARELVGRQSVKMVNGPTMEIPEEYRDQIAGYGKMQETIEALQLNQAERDFFDEVEKEVPGARAVEASEKFTAWLGKQSVGVSTLARSPDPIDAIAVHKAFKEFEVRAAATKVDERGARKKAKVDASNKKVVKSSASKTIDNGKDDFSAGFNS